MELDRLNALLAWWDLPNSMGSGIGDAQTRRFRAVVSNVLKSYGDACDRQQEALSSTNEQLGRWLQNLRRSRHPQDIVTAGSAIVTTFLEEGSQQARIWAEFTEAVQARCVVTTCGPISGAGVNGDRRRRRGGHPPR